jgi:uncharacterized protein
MRRLALGMAASLTFGSWAQAAGPCDGVKGPVIDVHLHAYDGDPRFEHRVPNPGTGKPSLAHDAESHRALTVAELRRRGVVRGIVSNDLADSERMVAAAPERLRLGYGIESLPTPQMLAEIRALHARGRLAWIGEVAPQYNGVAPNDPGLEPLWALAEELDLPVAYHLGRGPPDIVYMGRPKHRAAIGDPLLIEDVLVRHPKLKLVILHGGFPFGDNMAALMGAYPRVYIDLGAIHWAEDRGGFNAYLKRLIEGGFGKRIMFGSDQMVWPEAIGQSIDAYLRADFLTPQQRRDILFDNAVRFFGWTDLERCVR